MRRARGFLTLWLVFLVIGGWAPEETAAQTEAADEAAAADPAEDEAPSETGEEAAGEAAEYQGVPLTEVAVEGRNAELMLRDMRRELAGAGAVDRIRPLYEAELESNVGLVASLDGEQIAALDRRRLADLRGLLSESLAKMETWQSELTGRASVFEARFRQSKEAGTLWRNTQQEVEHPLVPPEVKDRVQRIISGVEEVEERLEQRLAVLLELQSDLADAELFIAESLDQVASAEGSYRGSTFVRDSPRLIRAIAESDLDLGRLTWKETVRRAQSVANYARRNPGRWLNQGIVFLILLGVMFFLKARSANWEAEGYDAPLETTRFLVTRPFSGALVLTLVASIWIHPNSPMGLGQALMIAALVPLARLLAGLASPKVRLPLIALGAIFLVHMGGDLFPEASPAQRMVLLVEMVIAAAGLAFLWHKRRERYRAASGWLGAMRFVVPTALAMTVGSVIANLAGRSQLATILADAVITGSALAVLVWICALICAAVSRLAVRRQKRHISNIVRNHSRDLERFFVFAINGVALFVWLRAFLGLLELHNPLVAWLRETIRHEWVVGKMTISLQTVLTFVLILAGAFGLARLIRVVLDEEIFARLRLPRGFPGLISLLLRYPIVLLGFLLAISAAGIDLTTFGLLAGALGVGIGFGMQNIINNFVSGLILTFERPIQVGDTIAVGQLLGNVTDIGVRSSKVKTFDGSEVIVPNADLISKEVINWTLSDRRRKMKLVVKVAYGSDPHLVMETLGRVAADHPDSLDDPPPKVLFNGHGENGLDFTLMYWVYFEKGISSKSDVALGIYDELAAAGIRAPIPRTQVTVAEGAHGDPTESAAAAGSVQSSAARAAAPGGVGHGSDG